MPEIKDFEASLATLWLCLHGLKQAQVCAENAKLKAGYVRDLEQAYDIVYKTIGEMLKEQYNTPIPIPKVQPLRFKAKSISNI